MKIFGVKRLFTLILNFQNYVKMYDGERIISKADNHNWEDKKKKDSETRNRLI